MFLFIICKYPLQIHNTIYNLLLQCNFLNKFVVFRLFVIYTSSIISTKEQLVAGCLSPILKKRGDDENEQKNFYNKVSRTYYSHIINYNNYYLNNKKIDTHS